MADDGPEFIEQWLSDNIHHDPFIGDRMDEEAKSKVAQLRRDAKAAGLDLSDPSLDEDTLYDEVLAAMESVYDPEAGGIKD